MPVDRHAAAAHDAAVGVGRAIGQVIESSGKTRREVCEQMGTDSGNLTRIIKGQQPGTLTVDWIARLERVLGCEPGTVYLAAGVVKIPTSVAALIDTDPHLDPDMRFAARFAYESALAASKSRRDSAIREAATSKRARA